jgi:AraC family transcriptional regulator of adaptative response/methylated-DNA-[protein]-cysteine methyltransferase
MIMNHEQAGCHDAAIHYSVGESSLGVVLVAQSERGIAAILMGDTRGELVADFERRFAGSRLRQDAAGVAASLAAVVAMIDTPSAACELTLDPQGTPFQQRVWAALREIARGTTQSYAEVARRIGAPQAVRAVAGACAANRLAVAIPCHRVRRSDGGLSGYRWGVARKRALLAREAHA